ncbi:amidohydrolase family protein [Aliidiomarina halalkaliphila]|uniref:Amidohydrolase family protein n=1 Tax=Aliidiomarina halalkaliphila TaxID=2593535 RepID=A0A552WZ03_9GAMM|nr:amidohydrolase family protein [Aliidiomarina halalkaliphila]TRW48052.1 amidohydrolase family protein [Aliidiomarina halalkaliphila]
MHTLTHTLKRWLPAAGLAAALCFSTTATANDKWSVNEPMGEFKTVQVNTDQGTWMSVNISPDGQYIIFDMLGDIYRMPASGGDAELLRGGIAWHMQPTYSPDGKYIAFTSDEGGGDNIWVMSADGSEAWQVTDESFRLLNSPAWSPDGNYLVARKHFTARRSLGAGEVWMYHKRGGQGVMLTARPNDQKDLGEPAFSPDGRYVYFSQDDTPGNTFHYNKDSVSGIYTIKRYDLETGEIDNIIGGMGGAIRPTPSPDGKRLAFVSRDDFQSKLYVYDLETGVRTEVYGDLTRDMQETWAIHGVYPHMNWTADSRDIVFYAKGKIHRVNTETKQASTIPFQVNVEKEVQQAVRFRQHIEEDSFDVRMLRSAVVSPSGDRVIYEALGHLYTRGLPNGTPERLTSRTDRFELFPSFSRNGQHLVYTTWNDQTQGQVIVRNLRSGQERVLPTGPGKFVEPVFSPDGDAVVYRKISGGYLSDPKHGLNTGIYYLALDSDEPKHISRNGSEPQFGSRSDRVYVNGFGASGPELRSIDVDTGESRTLYTSQHATEFRVSPDGQYLAFAERFRVFVTPFVERGQPIAIGPNDRQFPIEQLSQRAGDNLSWTADSASLYWTLGPELYSANLNGMFDISGKPDFTKVEDGTNISFSREQYVPDQTIAFVGGTVVTMNGDEVIENAIVVVEGNRITAIGQEPQVRVPRGAEVIDFTGKTMIPGLIDTHAHGAQGENQIIPQQNWILYAGLTFGVTTIHDPSNNTRQIFTASELQKAGKIVGPRIFSTGTILYGANGPGFTAHVDSLDDARFHLERMKKVGAFSVKSYNQPRRDQRQQIIQAARELEMLVMPEGGSLFQHNLSMVADGHSVIEHSIPTEVMYNDVLQFWSQTETAYTPTLGVAYGGIWGENYWYAHTDVWNHPRLSQYVPERVLRPRSMRREIAPSHHYNHFNIAAGANDLQEQGVMVTAGAHGQREGLAQHWEIWMMEQGGMTPLQALRTATYDAAKSLGMEHAIGSIEVGKLADIAIIDGNPLENLRQSDRVIYTMVNGRLFDAETMNELGRNARERRPFYFE